MSVTSSVGLHREGSIAILTLDRPQVLNAVDESLMDGLIARLAELRGLSAEPDGIGAAVLTGAGRAFCAGADRAMLSLLTEQPAAVGEALFAKGRRCIDGILDCPVPIIAAVRGHAVGGGVSFTLASDIALAAEDTIFFIPEVELGIPYLWGSTSLLAATTGLHRARALTLSCERFDAAQAEAWGILNRVVPGSQLLDDAMDQARRIAAMPRLAVRNQKRLNTRLLRRFMVADAEESALLP